MKNSVSVLVVIPTHNRANMLSEAIDSVLSQDYPDKRIIVVDDGSEDDTKKLCQRFTQSGLIRYIYKDNGGCASARNTGLRYMDEDIQYVCFLDSDDRQLPRFLSRAVHLLKANPTAGFCYTDSIVYDEDTGREKLQRVAAAGRPARFAIEHFLSNEAKPGSILYKADTVRNKYFREELRYNEDSEFLQRIAIEHQGVYCPYPATWVRWHAGSKSRNSLEINRSVLRASCDILTAYPTFYASFPETADRHIRKLEKALFASLMLNGDWMDAENLAKSFFERLFVASRVAAYYKLRQAARTVLRRVIA